MRARKLTSRREFIKLSALGAASAAILAACAPAAQPSPTAAPAQPTQAPKPAATTAPAAAASPTTAAAAKPTEAPKPAATTAPAPSGQRVSLRFVAMDYDDRMEADTKALMDKYNASQNKATAKVEIVKWSEGKNVLLTQISGGQAPDIANHSAQGMLEFNAAGEVEPLDNHLGADFLKDFAKAGLDAMRVEGKLMAMPYFLDPRGTFYRTDLFEQAGLKPPETWDDIRTAAKKLHNPPNVYGIGIGVSGPSGGSDYWWYAWIGAIGGDGNLSRWDENKRSRVASEPGIQAVQFLVDLARTDKVTQPNPVNAGRDEDLQPLFLAGKLAILQTGSWFPTILQHDAPQLKFDVAPIPVAKAGMKGVNAFWPDCVMMFKQSKNKDAATDLLMFMFNAPNRLDFAKQRGVVPERTDVGADPRYATSKFEKFFVKELERSYNVMLTPWPASGTEDGRAINDGVAKALLGEKSVKDAMQEAATAIDKRHGV